MSKLYHHHRAARSRTVTWSACVSSRPHDERAHGGGTTIEECVCGATRRIEHNLNFRAASYWTAPQRFLDTMEALRVS